MRVLLGLVALFVSVAVAAHYFYSFFDGDQPPEAGYRFIKTACWFDADWTATITCGELKTPENFHLAVVILHNDSDQRRADPIVYLQGGPGASARLHNDGIKSWLNWMRYSNTQRDLILIDPRGTGHSKPALQCNEYNQFNYQLLRQNLPLKDELEQGQNVALGCFAELAQQNSQLVYRNFSTRKSAQDVRALIAQLGYLEWNILGVSYGTRLALEIAQQEQKMKQQSQSAKLKSMVLDSIYPAGFGGVQTWPQVLDDGMQHFFNGCMEMPTCASKLNLSGVSLEQYFMNALYLLRLNPLSMTIRRWDGEAPITFLVNDHRFLSATFAAVYNPVDWSIIVDAINGVFEHRTILLKPLIEPYLNNSLTSDFNSLTFTAVDCADNPVYAEADYLESLKKYPLLQDYTRDQWRYQMCHQLQGELPLARAAPQVPTLILSGALDPITPLAWARAVHQEWDQSQLRVQKTLAHSVLSNDLCLLENLDIFFDHPTKKFTACSNQDDSNVK